MAIYCYFMLYSIVRKGAWNTGALQIEGKCRVLYSTERELQYSALTDYLPRYLRKYLTFSNTGSSLELARRL